MGYRNALPGGSSDQGPSRHFPALEGCFDPPDYFGLETTVGLVDVSSTEAQRTVGGVKLLSGLRQSNVLRKRSRRRV